MKFIEELSTVLHIDADLLVEILFQWFNTAVVIAVLAFLLFKPVKKFLHDRTERIRKQIEETTTNAKQAQSLKEEYETKISNVEVEKTKILENARKRALEKESQIIIEAKREAEAIISRAKLDTDRELDRARDEIKTQIVEVSTLMANRYIAANMDTPAQHKLLDEVINGLGDVKWHN